jgi:hypothetical protein
VGWAFRLLAASRRGRSSYTASSAEQRAREREEEREQHRRAKGTRGAREANPYDR